MPENNDITIIKPGDELGTCPSCGYGRGFHLSFQNMAAHKSELVRSIREMYRIILICP